MIRQGSSRVTGSSRSTGSASASSCCQSRESAPPSSGVSAATQCRTPGSSARSASAVVPCSRPWTTTVAPECSSTYSRLGRGEPGVDRHPDRAELPAGVERLQRRRGGWRRARRPGRRAARRGPPARPRPGGRGAANSPCGRRRPLEPDRRRAAGRSAAGARARSPGPRSSSRSPSARIAFSFRISGLTSCLMSSCSKSAIQRSGREQRVVRAEQHLVLAAARWPP